MKWLQRIRQKNSALPLDTPYTFKYTLGELPLPQPWRANPEGVFMLPLGFVLQFTDNERITLVRHHDKEHISELQESILKYGIMTPLEMWIDAEGKLRLQQGYHRMCVFMANRDLFIRVPIRLHVSDGRIKAYGRSVVSEIEFIFETLGKTI